MKKRLPDGNRAVDDGAAGSLSNRASASGSINRIGDQTAPTGRAVAARLVPQLAQLERDLAAARKEIEGAIRASAGQEDPPAREGVEVLALAGPNSELQRWLPEQRMLSDDLERILSGTDVAIIVLDPDLKLRFFTPAVQAVFAILPPELGRPLSDLLSSHMDGSLVADAKTVLDKHLHLEREVQAGSGAWFRRQIMPYAADDDGIGGVIVVFNDITKGKLAANALEEAKTQADRANIGKSRFLAATSHDLRQPLQTLALLHGLLAKTVRGARAQGLLVRVDDMLGAMSGMLDRLLDINEIETGVVDAKMASFEMNGLLDRMREEFSEQARAKGLTLRVLPCSVHVLSDPGLLEQITRNLLSNALKYTTHGKVLLGCRRQADGVSLEVWDTGMGIPKAELSAIFEEYHQLDNAARERSRGLGLGLSIVNRLATLLAHPVSVRSEKGKGSVFAVQIGRAAGPAKTGIQRALMASDIAPVVSVAHAGLILAVEDDPDMRELIGLLLESEGYLVVTAPDAPAALTLIASGAVIPDLLLTDYNLPNGLNGLQLAVELRARLDREIPVIILTGDISANTLCDVAARHCLHLSKPVKHQELMRLITEQLNGLMPGPAPPKPIGQLPMPYRPHTCTVFVVDDDSSIREAMRSVLEDDGRNAECFETGEAFLEAYRPGGEACLLVDAYLPGMNGIELLQRLRQAGDHLPAIMITGNSDVPMAVTAMKAGASDFIEKPIGRIELLASIERALEQTRDSTKMTAWRDEAATHVAGLTARQRQIMVMVLAGNPSKNIAMDLGISQRTVENHRASIMRKTGAASLPALARLALAATWDVGEAGPGQPPAISR